MCLWKEILRFLKMHITKQLCISTIFSCHSCTAGRWYAPCTPFSSTNKTNKHDITDISLTVSLNTITLLPQQYITNKACEFLNLNYIILYLFYIIKYNIKIMTVSLQLKVVIDQISSNMYHGGLWLMVVVSWLYI